MQNKSQCPLKGLLDPKGPRGIPLVNSLPFITWNVLKFLIGIRDNHGDIAKFKLFWFNFYLISHSEGITQVYKDEKKGTYKKTWFHKPFYSFFGNGLFNSVGKDWEQQRKLLQPFFNKSKIPEWFPLVTEETLTHFQPINNQTEFNAEDVIKPLMQSIMSRILFGLKPDNENSKKVIHAIEEVSEQLANHGLKSFILNGILNKLPTPGNLKYKAALKTINTSIHKISENTDKKDNHAIFPQFSKTMSPKQLRDEITTLYFAGQDTTVSTILWVIYYLAKHPDYQERARQEVLKIWPTRSDINFRDLDNLVFLNAAIDESMRLSPAAYLISRDIDRDVQLGQYRLKKDSLIMLSSYVTHRHPDLWDNPSKYIPERFLERKNKGYSFFPYGGGMRMCIGMHLARMEITTIAALFVTEFKFKLKPGIKIDPVTYMTLKPKNGIKLILEPIKVG